MNKLYLFVFLLLLHSYSFSQPTKKMHWSNEGRGYYTLTKGDIVYQEPGKSESITILKGNTKPLVIKNFEFSKNQKLILVQTNTKKVWRYETIGDYWVYNIESKKSFQIGKKFAASSLQFAKFSPDESKVAYVMGHNIYAEDLNTGIITQLTTTGTKQIINGTFDWAYEEEFFCRDGFRWSPNSQHIAYWQVNASNVKNYLMINNTDSSYPFAVPVEYPVAGEKPSPVKIGVVALSNKSTKWMKTPDDLHWGSYIPRMEWAPNGNALIVQHLNRKQNTSTLFLADIVTTKCVPLYKEQDSTWLDIMPLWDQSYANGGWDWLENGKQFLWANESDGWRHFYIQSTNSAPPICITPGAYDVMSTARVDIKNHRLFFYASPENATQQYLYVVDWNNPSSVKRLSPSNQQGTHSYTISPDGQFAKHVFSNINIAPVSEWIKLPGHEVIGDANVDAAIAKVIPQKNAPTFFKVTTSEGVTMDAWMVKPVDFDATKKYPVVFYVYTEPWGQTAKDEYGTGYNYLYNGNMADDGYIYISMDNRGTPVPKGRTWRKSVYQKIGNVNIRDQALGALEIFKFPFIDTSRVAVWGWSGGGSATLNLMFQYPEIYKTGISIAGVGSQLTYDNIYQERYMGLPQENKEVFVKGSPISYVKNLKGHLLYIHGTGDDNVHYQNAELLINSLIKERKQFSMMSYPNRTHSISEGEGTSAHLSALYTNYLRQNCPPGAR